MLGGVGIVRSGIVRRVVIVCVGIVRAGFSLIAPRSYKAPRHAASLASILQYFFGLCRQRQALLKPYGPRARCLLLGARDPHPFQSRARSAAKLLRTAYRCVAVQASAARRADRWGARACKHPQRLSRLGAPMQGFFSSSWLPVLVRDHVGVTAQRCPAALRFACRLMQAELPENQIMADCWIRGLRRPASLHPTWANAVASTVAFPVIQGLERDADWASPLFFAGQGRAGGTGTGAV
jgi:hypothetical protein